MQVTGGDSISRGKIFQVLEKVFALQIGHCAVYEFEFLMLLLKLMKFMDQVIFKEMNLFAELICFAKFLVQFHGIFSGDVIKIRNDVVEKIDGIIDEECCSVRKKSERQAFYLFPATGMPVVR